MDQLLGMKYSCGEEFVYDRGAPALLCQPLSAALAEPMPHVLESLRQDPVAYVDETSAPTGNADGNNPQGKRGLAVDHGDVRSDVVHLNSESFDGSRHRVTGEQLLRDCGERSLMAYNHAPHEHRQLCWVHLIRDLIVIAERTVATAQF